MVGAVPVCPPERPRSGVSMRKEHVPHRQRRRFHPQKYLCIAHDAHPLLMDAPSWGDTGGHTGTAPAVSFGQIARRQLVSFGRIARECRMAFDGLCMMLGHVV